MEQFDALIVGCGLSGSVIAERLVKELGWKVLIIDSRSHIGGNCYDVRDQETGILYNTRGVHILHTNSERVWKYINQFGSWRRYDHKVQVKTKEYGFQPFPPNLSTMNSFWKQHFQTKEQVIQFMTNSNEIVPCKLPKNSEELGLSKFGKTFYNQLFLGYTYKQWDKDPKYLDASVLDRIPMHYDFNQGYFTDKYQALPEKGYTAWFDNLFASIQDQCEVKTNTDFFTLSPSIRYKHLFFTGPIDHYVQHLFPELTLPPLEYRSINFVIERPKVGEGLFQPSMVVNYPELSEPWTRICEYKHYLGQYEKQNSLIVKEFPSSVGEPFYPVPNEKNQKLFQEYQDLVSDYAKKHNVHFIGRMATYKYINMDSAVENALEYFDKFKASLSETE